jgi:NinB protein
VKVTLHNPQQGHTAFQSLWPQIKALLFAEKRLIVEVKEATRSTEQNARMWAMLTEVSNQVVWHGRKLTPEEWKHVFTASLKRQDVVPGLDGGFVVLGQSTSKMGVREMGELMELISAFSAQQGVKFSAPEWMEEHA